MIIYFVHALEAESCDPDVFKSYTGFLWLQNKSSKTWMNKLLSEVVY